MKKLSLTVLGLYVGLLAAFSQGSQDSGVYKSRKLTLDEANVVTSYYQQDGNRSAVTGGIGTEKLSDLSTAFELKLNKYDRKNRKHIWDLELGIDHYTSASSDKIDPHTISSASSADTRVYPSLTWTVENEAKGRSVSAGVSYSNEFDYQSVGIHAGYSKKSKDKSAELSANLQAYFDQVSIILPVELRTGPAGEDEDDYGRQGRNSFSASLSYSKIINQRLQLMVIGDAIYQTGFLSLPFHRIYFADNSESTEKLPSNRFKLPLGFRANYFLGDKFIVRTFYRYYADSWGLKAHTANVETSVKITPFISLTPFYRFYKQDGVNYFAGYQEHLPTETFYTSNYDLAPFNSHFFGMGFRTSPPNGVFGIQHLNMLEIRYGHYLKTMGMTSNIISMNLKFK